MNVWNSPLAHFSAFASSATTARLRPGSGSGVCVPPGNGGDQLIRDSSFGFDLVAEIVNRESAVAPRAVAAIAGDDHVMQRDALAPLERVGLAAGAMHAGQPPLRHDLRLRDVLQIDDGEDVIRVAVEVHREIRIASAGPPQAVDAEAGDLEKRDLAHVRRLRDVVDAQSRSELLPVRDAVDERVLEVAAHVVVRLHRDDVRAVREKQEIVGHLQMMRARVRAGGEETRPA